MIDQATAARIAEQISAMQQASKLHPHDWRVLERLVQQLSDQIAGLTQTGWQPIETAPKDGTPVWLVEDGASMGVIIAHQFVGAWVPSRKLTAGGFWLHVYRNLIGHPTHWMRLPDTPSAFPRDETGERSMRNDLARTGETDAVSTVAVPHSPTEKA
jgi:hypothetical protein